MLRLLETFRTEQRTIVLTTHQRELAEPLADFVLTLKPGAVVNPGRGAVCEARCFDLGCDGRNGVAAMTTSAKLAAQDECCAVPGFAGNCV